MMTAMPQNQTQRSSASSATDGNYHWSIRILLVLASAMAIFLLTEHGFEIAGMPEWLMEFFRAVLAYDFVSKMISGMGYQAQWWDVITNGKNFYRFFRSSAQTIADSVSKLYHRLTFSAVGLTIGFISALIYSGIKIASHAPLEFVDMVGFPISSIVCIIKFTSDFCGLGNRSGAIVDVYRQAINNNFRAERINYAIGVTVGLLLGAGLLAFIIATGGIGIFPAICFISTFASAGGYFGRVGDLLFGSATVVHMVKDLICAQDRGAEWKKQKAALWQRCTEERVSTALWIGVGIAIGVVLIAAGIGTLPFFGIGLPKLIGGIALVTACASFSGGFGNRTGAAKVWSKIGGGICKAVRTVHRNIQSIKKAFTFQPKALLIPVPPVQTQTYSSSISSVSSSPVPSRRSLRSAEETLGQWKTRKSENKQNKAGFAKFSRSFFGIAMPSKTASTLDISSPRMLGYCG